MVLEYLPAAHAVHNEPSLKPYAYLLHGSRLQFLDVFGFGEALHVAQTTVAKSGDYALEKYGLVGAVWPPAKDGA